MHQVLSMFKTPAILRRYIALESHWNHSWFTRVILNLQFWGDKNCIKLCDNNRLCKWAFIYLKILYLNNFLIQKIEEKSTEFYISNYYLTGKSEQCSLKKLNSKQMTDRKKITCIQFHAQKKIESFLLLNGQMQHW